MSVANNLAIKRRMQNDLIPLTLHSQGKNDKCGVRSAERPCLSAECGTRSAERLHYTTFRSQGKVHITNYLDFEIWMQYATKVKQQRDAVLTYCALKGFCL